MKKLVGIFMFVFALLISLTSARADLVEDIVKKYKLDPKNNAKDQCLLMYMLEMELNKQLSTKSYCDRGVCKVFTAMYHFNEKDQNWYGPGHSYMIYRSSSYEILGRSLDPENYYELSDEEFLNFVKKETKYMIDIRAHKKFREAEKQWKEEMLLKEKLKKIPISERSKLLQERNKSQTISVLGNFEDGALRLADVNTPMQNFTYIKTRGCYIDESKFVKEYLRENSN